MFKSRISFFAFLLFAVTLIGCTPRMRSMGAAVEMAPVTHRADASNKDQQMQLDASGFGSMSNETENVSNVRALGGSASFTYRMGGGASFLFLNAALSGFHGNLKFACTDEDCEDPDDDYYRAYHKWLATSEGRKRYDFTNLQERVLVGMDFNLGSYLFVGLAAGAQAFQGGGSYDKKREALATDTVVINGDDEDDPMVTLYSPVIRDADGRYGSGFTTVSWIGVRFGKQSQYGNLSMEWSVFYKGGPGMWTDSWKLTYWHPTGFYGGAAWGDLLNYTVYAGKTFVF